ncbi:hypothetical protein BDD14_0311 [Edaphobacter modestus]|uniref:Uncharacterized protein n=1 Tax=Edaphobacter modestus TaxID=388466 RepID=A0A4V2G419_9BACT|nr:hypothetical protein BDD14_0311 [Edaphobacter modestus]
MTSGVAGARCCWPAADRHIAESAAHVRSFMVMFSRTLCLLIVLSAVARLQFSDWCDKAYTPPTAQAIGIWIDPGRNGSSSFAYRHRNSRRTELRCPVLSESPDARLPSRTLINRDLWYGLLWKKPDPGDRFRDVDSRANFRIPILENSCFQRARKGKMTTEGIVRQTKNQEHRVTYRQSINLLLHNLLTAEFTFKYRSILFG